MALSKANFLSTGGVVPECDPDARAALAGARDSAALDAVAARDPEVREVRKAAEVAYRKANPKASAAAVKDAGEEAVREFLDA